MASLKDALAYVLLNYPEHMADELSNARVTKMLYLSDWHQAIKHGRQITPIQWYFDNYGPYVNDVRLEAAKYPELLSVKEGPNMFGQPKVTLGIKDRSYRPEQLNAEEKLSLDHVITQTHKMYWDSFINLVYSTYPIMQSRRYTKLDLIQLASDYKKTSEQN